ncbi:unnamed protein product, partial [Trichobilharzia regenti]
IFSIVPAFFLFIFYSFQETISTPQKNPVNNGSYKTNYEVKAIHQNPQQQPQQQHLPSKVTNYPHQPLSNTHEILLSKSNQKTLNGNWTDMSTLNKSNLLNLTHYNNSTRNYDRYSSQIRKSIKTTEPLNTTLNTRIQPIQSVGNNYPQWIVRNQLNNGKHITNEVCEVITMVIFQFCFIIVIIPLGSE